VAPVEAIAPGSLGIGSAEALRAGVGSGATRRGAGGVGSARDGAGAMLAEGGTGGVVGGPSSAKRAPRDRNNSIIPTG